MSFAHPDRLWLLVPVAVVAVWYALVLLRRPRYVVRFTNLALLDLVAPRQPGWRRHVTAVLFLAGLALLATALAGPVATRQVTTRSAVVVLAIDVSPSMLARDVAPSRLDAARAAAKDFLDLLPDGFQVGVVTFAGTAQVRVPPTSDHDLVAAALEQLEARSETAIGDAILASLDAVGTTARLRGGSGPRVPATVLLLSDGAQTTGREVGEGIAAAQEAGVAVSTVAFGTAGGTVELGGETLAVPPDKPTVERVAAETGGACFVAETGAELRAAYETMAAGLVTTTAEVDLTDETVAAVGVAVVLAGVLSLLWFQRLP